MPSEGHHKIKALVLVAMLGVAEVRQVQQNVRVSTKLRSRAGSMQAMSADSDPREQAHHTSELKETMMAESHLHEQHLADQLAAMAADPKLQEQIKRVAKFVSTEDVNPKAQKEIERVVGEIEAAFVDLGFQEQAKLVAEHWKPMKARLHMKAYAKRIIEQLGRLTSDHRYQDQAKLFAERMQAIMADPRLHAHTNKLIEQMDAGRTDQQFQGHAHRIARPLEVLMLDLKMRMQELHCPRFIEVGSDGSNLQDQIECISKHVVAMLRNSSLQDQVRHLAKEMREEQVARVPCPLAEQTPGNPLFESQLETARDSKDIWVDSLVDKLFGRSLRGATRSQQFSDRTTLGKSGFDATPQAEDHSGSETTKQKENALQPQCTDPYAKLVSSCICDGADFVGATVWLVGCIFFLPSLSVNPDATTNTIYLWACILFILGEWVYIVLGAYYLKNAIRSNKVITDTHEALGNFFGGMFFFMGTVLFLPDNLGAPIDAVVNLWKRTSQCFSPFLNIVGNTDGVQLQAGPVFAGAFLCAMGSFAFTVGSFATGLGLTSFESSAEQLTAFSVSCHLIGGLFFTVGSPGFTGQVGCGSRMVAMGAWNYAIGCVFFMLGACCALGRNWMNYLDATRRKQKRQKTRYRIQGNEGDPARISDIP